VIAFGFQCQVAIAHRLDEILQAALITVEPDAILIELNLTPGVETFPSLLPLLDLNGDGTLSDLETEAYADLVRFDLSLQLDESPLVLSLAQRRFPSVAELGVGLGTIHLEFSARLKSLPLGQHELRFLNRHRPDQSSYLVNALVPKAKALQVICQHRNVNQSQSRIRVKV
jgi:hypothetical protein